ncbi:MAG TPA: branched-chain amino acid ABC transporter substrate-binding protein, partial [Anaerolineae bacterium]|nr:branched-chain amino acid ABC transporter substrate-binding protein [Anaerolineae bacterium]
DAANILLQAIEKAGTDDAVKVAETMAGMEFDVVSGHISFDEYHNPVKSAVILQVKDGEIHYITTVSP